MRQFKNMSDQTLIQAIQVARAIIDPCTSESVWLDHLEMEYEARQFSRRLGLNGGYLRETASSIRHAA